ncbi:MAG: asparagine--tRNA ligase [Candidatus Micrarchaeota archaeon]|nr:asparagine--tRNA ligase [Candidatus Micrarchaeota archaeon]MDE1834187.1 asparagine--tRNA ligase [Candidatus Micrarchaeota archaeon]MDE1859159.1 asparagine--tRNA ligase [Candidatus Micrarchaeota archaeon]
MAPVVSVAKAAKKPASPVTLSGWIHRKRESGGIIFIVLRDVTGLMQVAIKKDSVSEASWKMASEATVESSVEVQGRVSEDKRSPTGFELHASSFKHINVSEPFPITEYQSVELLLDKRHLWLRSQRMINIMRARSHIFRYAREFLDRNGFYEVTPPAITKVGGETGADMFELDFFGSRAYLTESSQLYAEAMAFSLERVYSLAPSYRAENSRTTKHLSEYWHLEPEMLYFDNKKSMALQEKLVSHIANHLARHEDILAALSVNKDDLLKIKPPFKRLSYEDALSLLNQKGFSLKWGDDFGVEHERALTESEDKPVFIHSWPSEIKPFYMPINPKDERTVLCADLQAPKGHGEIIGGSERIWKYEDLIARMADVEKAKGVKFNMKNYEWWIDLRKYGSVPHSGFGMGMERIIKWLLGLDHIRDAIPFPRMSNRLEP